MADADEDAGKRESQVQQVVRALLERQDVDATAADLEPLVRRALDDLKDAPVQDFVTVLAERAVRDQLRRNRP